MVRGEPDASTPLLERAAEPKRTAMLTAVMRHLEAKAIDKALDLFQVLMATRLLGTAKRKTENGVTAPISGCGPRRYDGRAGSS
ncbi:hypothetical protein [Streptomyces sp. NBC_00467]|uniref:hypothetical protein n=1 Tax=Streptomyces sp. NBC_00467 TaxID=2975752 RepID=UPI002E183A6F